jgi:hypothetical protein
MYVYGTGHNATMKEGSQVNTAHLHSLAQGPEVHPALASPHNISICKPPAKRRVQQRWHLAPVQQQLLLNLINRCRRCQLDGPCAGWVLLLLSLKGVLHYWPPQTLL